MSDLGIDRNTQTLTGALVTGLEALAQRVWFRLSRLRGEWHLDLDTGLPADLIGRKPADLPSLREQVRAELANVAGVLEVVSVDVSIDTNRHVTITTRIRGVQGTTGVTV